MAFAQRRKNADLAIVHLALTPAPLALNTHRIFAFLGKAAFIDEQTAVGGTAQPLIGFPCHLVEDRTMIPWRVGEHVLKELLIRIDDRFFHALHVLSFGLHQPIEIMASRCKHRARLKLEVRFEAAVKTAKTFGDVI